MLNGLTFRSSRRAEPAAELRRWAKAMRNVLLFSVYCLTITLAAAETTGPAISIMEDGTLAIRGSADVPRYAGDGHWTEMRGKSSARYVTRHFLFILPCAASTYSKPPRKALASRRRSPRRFTSGLPISSVRHAMAIGAPVSGVFNEYSYGVHETTGP